MIVSLRIIGLMLTAIGLSFSEPTEDSSSDQPQRDISTEDDVRFPNEEAQMEEIAHDADMTSIVRSAISRQMGTSILDDCTVKYTDSGYFPQCYCVKPVGSNECFPYDSRYQAATFEEAMMNFVDPATGRDTMLHSSQVGMDNVACSDDACRQCAKLVLTRLFMTLAASSPAHGQCRSAIIPQITGLFRTLELETVNTHCPWLKAEAAEALAASVQFTSASDKTDTSTSSSERQEQGGEKLRETIDPGEFPSNDFATTVSNEELAKIAQLIRGDDPLDTAAPTSTGTSTERRDLSGSVSPPPERNPASSSSGTVGSTTSDSRRRNDTSHENAQRSNEKPSDKTPKQDPSNAAADAPQSANNGATLQSDPGAADASSSANSAPPPGDAGSSGQSSATSQSTSSSSAQPISSGNAQSSVLNSQSNPVSSSSTGGVQVQGHDLGVDLGGGHGSDSGHGIGDLWHNGGDIVDRTRIGDGIAASTSGSTSQGSASSSRTSINSISDLINLLGGRRTGPTTFEISPGRRKRSGRISSRHRLKWTIDCHNRGESADDDNPEWLGLCNSCWQIAVFKDNIFPKFVNQLACQPDTKCLSGYGKCMQSYKSMTVLRNDGNDTDTVNPDNWTKVTINVPTGCQCAVDSSSALERFISN